MDCLWIRSFFAALRLSFCDQAQSYVNMYKWFWEQILFHVLPRVQASQDNLWPLISSCAGSHMSFYISKTPFYSESIQNASHD